MYVVMQIPRSQQTRGRAAARQGVTVASWKHGNKRGELGRLSMCVCLSIGVSICAWVLSTSHPSHNFNAYSAA